MLINDLGKLLRISIIVLLGRLMSFCIKDKSFGEIKKKAEFLNQTWSRLKGKLTSPEVSFTFLYQNEYAPLIGTICDEKVKSEDAGTFPEWLNSKLGGITSEKILKLRKKGVKEVLEGYFENKWPGGMKEEDKEKYLEKTSSYIVEAMKFLKEKSITPITMFEDRPYTAAEVYFMLRLIPGIGPKKAKMITKYFLYASMGILEHYHWFDQIRAKNPKFKVAGVIMPPIDVQAVKVFCRVFGVNLGEWDKAKSNSDLIQDIEAFSLLASPDKPVIIDEIFWNVGRTYCYGKAPNCQECPLNEICDYVRRT